MSENGHWRARAAGDDRPQWRGRWQRYEAARRQARLWWLREDRARIWVESRSGYVEPVLGFARGERPAPYDPAVNP